MNKNILKTGNSSVDLLATLSVQGDVIPPKCYKLIKKDSGKTDMLAVSILSNIIYWHRPTPVCDANGNVIGNRKKFAGEKLQKNYDEYCELYDVTKRQVKASFDVLEKLGFIKRTFQTITLRGGVKIPNVMFVELVNEKLSLLFDSQDKDYVSKNDEISMHQSLESAPSLAITEKRVTSEPEMDYTIQFFVTPPTKNCKTNTNNNSNNTTYTNHLSFNHPEPNDDFTNERKSEMSEKVYREIIADNVELNSLIEEQPIHADEYLEYFEIMVDLVCHNTKPIKVHGQLYPAEVVKSQMLKLRREHFEHVNDVYEAYRGDIHNFYSHCAATLYNSLFMTNSLIKNKVRNNMYKVS